MKLKNVIDESTRKVYKFNNKDKVINYIAKIVENGEVINFSTEYTETGIVTDVETKINAFGNVVAATYAAAVDYNSSKNDPDKKIWNKFVKEVTENPGKYFTKDGDWRKRISVDAKKNLIIEEVK